MLYIQMQFKGSKDTPEIPLLPFLALLMYACMTNYLSHSLKLCLVRRTCPHPASSCPVHSPHYPGIRGRKGEEWGIHVSVKIVFFSKRWLLGDSLSRAYVSFSRCLYWLYPRYEFLMTITDFILTLICNATLWCTIASNLFLCILNSIKKNCMVLLQNGTTIRFVRLFYLPQAFASKIFHFFFSNL